MILVHCVCRKLSLLLQNIVHQWYGYVLFQPFGNWFTLLIAKIYKLSTKYGLNPISNGDVVTCTSFMGPWPLFILNMMIENAPTRDQHINVLYFFTKSIGWWRNWTTCWNPHVAVVPVNSNSWKQMIMISLPRVSSQEPKVYKQPKYIRRKSLAPDEAAASSKYFKINTLDLNSASSILSGSRNFKNQSKGQLFSMQKVPSHNPLIPSWKALVDGEDPLVLLKGQCVSIA